MKRLVYCIFRQDGASYAPEPGTCHVAAANGLAAVVSQTEPAPPDIWSLLGFERVVEAMHAEQDVIPLRYGCVIESDAAVVRLLEDHRQEYKRLLERLFGMTEMGIRLLCPARPETPLRSPLSPGAQHLAALRDRHHLRSVPVTEETELADRVAGLLAGCYAEQRRESTNAAGGGRLLSLYFLTPRRDVKLFRERARLITLAGIGILRSGPWPPWNFAMPEA